MEKEINYPVYRENHENEIFKIESKTFMKAVINDRLIMIGESDDKKFIKISLSLYKESSEEKFNQLYNKVLEKMNLKKIE